MKKLPHFLLLALLSSFHLTACADDKAAAPAATPPASEAKPADAAPSAPAATGEAKPADAAAPADGAKPAEEGKKEGKKGDGEGDCN